MNDDLPIEPDPEPIAAPSSVGSTGDVPSAGRRHEVLATLVIVGALVAAVAARPVSRRMAAHPTREECVTMLDRYAEEEARAADPVRGEKGPSLDESAPRTLASTTLDRCTRDLTREEVTCALHSNGADELERCISP